MDSSAPDVDDAASRSSDVPSAPRAVLGRGVTVGRYIIVDRVGEGGMGVVYKAYDPELERAVALKFLHARGADAGGSTGAQRGWLLREAKALARLSHPNVLAVFDVGVSGSDVFLATEFVEGPTLDVWLREAKRSRREIVRVFAAAGEGLAAAHRAGLVHRDFKPTNVMIGRDGRVRVLDFGVARIEVGEKRPRASVIPPPVTAAPEPGTATRPPPRPSEAPRTLSAGGEIIGTPRYMAPEQHLDEPVSAKADQFSFAVTLYEALYGEPPFEGTDAAYVENLVMGHVRPAPAGSDVPRWMRHVVLRALAPDPGDRHPSMDALLAGLHDDPAVRRRRWLVGGLAVVGVALLGVSAAAVQRERFGVCRGAERKLDGVWDAPRRQAVALAFAKTSAPYAAEAARAVTVALDDYTRDWAAQRTGACEATRIKGEQSEELLDLRMQCLDARLAEVRERTALLVTGDPGVVEKAVESVHRLSPLSSCSDAAGLRAPVPLPSTAGARERLEQLRARVARASALVDAMRLPEAAIEAKAAVDVARELAYAPALAEALRTRALVEERAGEYDAAAATYRDAIAAAEAGHHEEVAARAWSELISVIGERLGHFDEARGLLWIARAKVARLTEPMDLPARLLLVDATLDWRKGRYTSAETSAREAVRSLEALRGPRHPDVGQALGLLGLVEDAEGKVAEAEACHARELAIMEETFGAEHPRTMAALTHLADARGAGGDHRAAVDLYERALPIYVRSMGAEHPNVAKLHNNLADELIAVGEPDRAIAHEQQAIAIWERSVGLHNVDLASGLYNLAAAYLLRGDVALAIPPLRRSLAIFTETFGPSHLALMADLVALAQALRATGDATEARAFEARALDLDAKLSPADREYDLPARVALGELQLARGLAGRAVATIEPAVSAPIESGRDAATLAPARFLLARALVASGGSRERARLLAQQALEGLRARGPRSARDAGAVERWLAQP